MSRRFVFRSFLAATAIGWLLWCLYWPYFVLEHDKQAALREADDTRKVCLQQANLTVDECTADYRLYQRRLLQAAVPPGKNAYQLFAGESAGAATGFMTALISIPLTAFYLAARLSLGACRMLARAIR